MPRRLPRSRRGGGAAGAAEAAYRGRISGTPYERTTADWTEVRFRELGMETIHGVKFDLGP